MTLERRIQSLENEAIAAEPQPQLVVIVEGEEVPREVPYIEVVSENARGLIERILAGERTA